MKGPSLKNNINFNLHFPNSERINWNKREMEGTSASYYFPLFLSPFLSLPLSLYNSFFKSPFLSLGHLNIYIFLLFRGCFFFFFFAKMNELHSNSVSENRRTLLLLL